MKPRMSVLEPVAIEEIYKKSYRELNAALFLPSRVDGYSLCVEYVFNWFMSKFKKPTKDGEVGSFFNSVNLDGHDPFNDMKRWTIKDWIKRQKPCVSIIPKLDVKFNRDFIDDDFNSVMGYVNRTKDECTFFIDDDNNSFVGMVKRLNKVDFNIKIKVGQRPLQLDVYEHILMNCKVGKSITFYASVDFLVPDKLITRMCKDLHFETDENGWPADHTAFLNYMNSHSDLPFLYKIRGVNRRLEFFVRVTDLMVHMRDIDLDVDDGEKEGMVYTNYTLDMNLSCYMPCPKYFVYWSKYEFEGMIYRDTATGDLYSAELVVTPIPTRNANNWPIYLDGTYENNRDNEPIKASIYDLFETSEDVANPILKVINDCKIKGISPDKFIESKVFNGMKEQESYVDWKAMILQTRGVMQNKTSSIVVYCDLLYMNNMIIEMDKLYDDRLR